MAGPNMSIRGIRGIRSIRGILGILDLPLRNLNSEDLVEYRRSGWPTRAPREVSR